MNELVDVPVYITDGDTGEVLSGTHIELVNDNLEEFKCTTVAGVCILNNVPPGQYTYTISKEGYSTLTGDIEISENSIIEFSLYSE